MHDGAEYALGYDPLDPNPDGDDYNDFEEFNLGKDPYVYEWEMTFEDHVGAVGYGVIFGDFADDDLINTDVLIGQIAGSYVPIVADARDMIANAIKGDWFMAGMSGIGLIPVAGDAVKTVANLGQTVAKMGDDIPAITKLVVGVVEEHPSIVKHLGKSDEVVEAIQDASKSKNITKESLEKVMKYADEASITISKSSDLLKNSDDMVEGLEGVWNKGPVLRGQDIDNHINNHTGEFVGNAKHGLGTNFPVVDRLDGEKLVSTKSIDLGAPSYKSSGALKSRMRSYLRQLDGFEDKYKAVINSPEGLEWGESALKYDQYSSKVLEIVFPDVPLTHEQSKAIRDFLGEVADLTKNSEKKIEIKILVTKG